MRQELSDIRTAPSLRCGTGPLARAGHLDERDAAPTGLEHLGRSPAFFPIPYLLLLSYPSTRPVSSRFPAEIGPLLPSLLLTYLFSEGT